MFTNIDIHVWMEKHQGPSPSDRYPRIISSTTDHPAVGSGHAYTSILFSWLQRDMVRKPKNERVLLPITTTTGMGRT